MATPKLFAQAAVTTTSATIYTVPASSVGVLKQIIVANTNVGSNAIRIHVCGSAGAAPTQANQLWPDVSVDGKRPAQDLYFLPIGPGGYVNVMANSAGMSVTLGGVEEP